MTCPFEDPRPVRFGGKADVVVAGGGIAGIAAAVAAARQGANTLLLEKGIVLGGLATAGLINWYEPLCDGEGTQMTGGIAEELIRLSTRYGPDGPPEAWLRKENTRSEPKRYATAFSPTIFALALNDYLQQNHVRLLLDAVITYPVMENTVCRGVVAELKEGRSFFEASAVIDATGDACVLHAAGAPTVEGSNYLTYVSHLIDSSGAEILAEKKAFGRLRRPWNMLGASRTGDGQPENVPCTPGLTGEEITRFVRAGQEMLFEQIRRLPKGSFDVVSLPSIPQLRTSRHLKGGYTFTGKAWERRFPDAIGACGDFRRRGERFQIPYRTLYHPDYPNLYAAGRIISSSGEGWEITRVIPVCAMTGQAAGTAAAIAASESCGAAEVDISRLQDILRSNGAILDGI